MLAIAELISFSGHEVMKLFSCSTQLSIKFQLLIKTNRAVKGGVFLAFELLYDVFNLLINVKMPTIVGILASMSRITFMLSWVEHKKVV